MKVLQLVDDSDNSWAEKMAEKKEYWLVELTDKIRVCRMVSYKGALTETKSAE